MLFKTNYNLIGLKVHLVLTQLITQISFFQAATSRPVSETEKQTEGDGAEKQWIRVVLAIDRLTLLVYGGVFAILGIQLSLA